MTSEATTYYSWYIDATAICIRYFLIAGAGYFVFYKWKKNQFAGIKIQKKFPEWLVIQKELLYSLSTLTIYCSVSGLVFYWQKSGLTKIYTDMHQYGYPYFFCSIIIMIVFHDAYFYWTHRILHIPGIFRMVHQTHHLSVNPTPWATFSFHPLEAVIAAGIIPIIVFLLPTHTFAIFAFLTYMILINVMGHLGYELFPEKFVSGKIGKWQNTSTNHNLHHQTSIGNYGLYFTFWDRIMHTYYADNKK